MFELVELPASDDGGAAPRAVAGPEVDPVASAEFAECSGAILAKLVADAMAGVPDIPDTVEGDAQLMDLITATSRVDAWSESIRCRLTALLYERTLAEHRRFGLAAHADGHGTAAGASHGYDDVAFTRSEVAGNLSLELGQSLPVADRAVTTALGLARTPVAHQALAVGRMDPPQATALMTELDHVPDPALRQDIAAALAMDPQQPDPTRSWCASCVARASGSGTCPRPRSAPSSAARWPSESRSSPRAGCGPSRKHDTSGTTRCATGWVSWCCTARRLC